LLPVANKQTKFAKSPQEEQTIFKLFASSIKTNRDEWVYDFEQKTLNDKMTFFTNIYNEEVKKHSKLSSISAINDILNYAIKWSRDLKNELLRERKSIFSEEKIIISHWRPFTRKLFYSEFLFSDVLTQNHYAIWGNDLDKQNQVINISGTSAMKPFQVLSTKQPSDYEFVEKNQCLPLYRYDEQGSRRDNITEWGLRQFRAHYQDARISKLDIFHYTYAVLHHPAYREKYALNLKREFPRLPFYADFWQWAQWGKALMDLHLHYETAEPYPLERREQQQQMDATSEVESISPPPKPKLKADKLKHAIILDAATALHGVPPVAWEYKLGNRSALEWVLDQYKEKKPRDPTIRERFNTYRFADYKEPVIDLLRRVCTVSARTVQIIQQMDCGPE
jgi:predicted helicase